jgi:hypothetical protein
MDVHTLFDQARVAAFVIEMLATIPPILLSDDVEIPLKNPTQQRLQWDKFVEDYKNQPLFKRHMRMTYASFCRFARHD